MIYKAKVWYWDEDGVVQELEEHCLTLARARQLIDLVQMIMACEENPDTFAKSIIYMMEEKK